jgi:broad specificity phosphatase PhoE
MAISIKYYPHGTTFDNEAGIATGQADTDLSPLGEQQVQQLAKHERSEQFL